MKLVLSPQQLGFIVATRAALGVGLGLLLANRVGKSRRQRIGLTLLSIGAATTIPALRNVLRSRTSDAQLALPIDEPLEI
jgi:hypothetical protein